MEKDQMQNAVTSKRNTDRSLHSNLSFIVICMHVD